MPSALRPPKLVARSISVGVQIEVAHHSDWNDSVQLREAGVPMDLTGATIELSVRPAYDDDFLALFLSSALGDVLMDDAGRGCLQIYVPGWRVATVPAGRWVFVMRILKAGEAREVARGPFIVHAARYSA